MIKGLYGYGRYEDGTIACPRAHSDMTPCAARDGQVAVAADGTCVGCGKYPASILQNVVKLISQVAKAAEEGE